MRDYKFKVTPRHIAMSILAVLCWDLGVYRENSYIKNAITGFFTPEVKNHETEPNPNIRPFYRRDKKNLHDKYRKIREFERELEKDLENQRRQEKRDDYLFV